MFRPYTYVGKYPAQNERFGFMGYLKGKSSLMIYLKWGNMKFAYHNREWCKGYNVDTVGKNTSAIKEYIDKEADQLSVVDPERPI